MAAINKTPWFKEHLLLRIFGITFWLFGLAIYLSFFVLGWIDISHHKHLKNFSFVSFFIKEILLFPGLVPLIIGGFFLVFFRRSEDFFLGAFLILPSFIVLHYVVAAVSAHNDGWQYLCFQLFEIACAVVVIIKFKRKWKAIAEKKESSG